MLANKLLQCCLSVIRPCQGQVRCLAALKPRAIRNAKPRVSVVGLYVKENFQSIKFQYPQASNADLFKVLSQNWKQLTSDEQQIYRDKATKQQQQYNDEYESLTDEQRYDLIAERQLKVTKKFAANLVKEKTKNGRPRRPMAGYHYYFLAKGEKSVEVGGEQWKGLKNEFNALPANEKEIYEGKAAEDSLRYRQEMTEWVARMLQEGKDHLVSNYAKQKYRMF
ncbi:TFAM [Bugula neritina]|uniref:TFAM n=1 Tax=Bugula neritina TaxID=10212 RepID=A0A7J7KMX4_BUGNE|nr:TFAM [Bugula neritina]